MRTAIEVFNRHVDLFNAGVRTGDFDPMVEGFAEDAEMRFEGVPAGPFVGPEAIRSAYRAQPPDDEVRILETTESRADAVEARYSWLQAQGKPAGLMRMKVHNGLITELVVTFDA